MNLSPFLQGLEVFALGFAALGFMIHRDRKARS